VQQVSAAGDAGGREPRCTENGSCEDGWKTLHRSNIPSSFNWAS
jgi:hypothetical protein